MSLKLNCQRSVARCKSKAPEAQLASGAFNSVLECVGFDKGFELSFKHSLKRARGGLPALGRGACESLSDIVEPLMGEIHVHSVHNRNLVIKDYVGIIRHPVWNRILSLKQVDDMVINANIADISNVHLTAPFTIMCLFYHYKL